ncbi:MAG: hypothetical protein R3F02_08255 [Thiolinea sp.]
MSNMNYFKKNHLKRTGLTLAILISSALAAPVFADDSGSGATATPVIQQNIMRQDFIGSWIVSIDDGYKSPYLFSFLPGGVIIQSENPLIDPLRGNLAFSSAHGAWQQNPDGSFSIRYFKQAYDADGQYVGLEETNGILSFNQENNLAGKLTVGKIRQDSSGENEIDQSDILFSGTKITAGNP